MIRYPLLRNMAQQSSDFVQAKDGLVTLRVGERFVHSPYSPGKEALRLVEGLKGLDPSKTFVIFLGAGLGYHIELLEKEGFERGVVIETHPEIAKIFQTVYELPSSLYWIGPEQTEEALDSIFALLDFGSIRWVKTLVLRGSYELGNYDAFEKRIQRLAQVKLGDFSTRLKFEEIWLVHMIRNIDNLPFSTPLSELFFRQNNFPVVIVSAGPSLRESLPALRRVASSVFMVAVDTALLPLYEAGIVPDLVYSLDAQVHTLEDFVGIEKDFLSRIHLVYDIVAHPQTLAFVREASPGPHYVATTAHGDIDPQGNPFLLKHEFVRWLELTTNTSLGDVETGGSVSTSVFHASFLMGGNPLILVGQDLAFSYQTTHVASTSHYYRYSPLSHRLHPINTIFFEAILSRRLQKHRGIRQEEIDSDFVLSNFKGWFEVSAKRLAEFRGIRCINATHEGVWLDGFVHEDIEHLFHTLAPSPVIKEKEKIFLSKPFSLSSLRKVKEGLIHIKERLRTFPCDERWYERIGEMGYVFLERYFMREKMLFERYGNHDRVSLERKTYRLIKAIEGLRDE
ncbi:MAG: DUF115 domain-containing protein [Brevinematales bacterium]|nr:DUF115 domain-containing protein [Brevinematales bacterium]